MKTFLVDQETANHHSGGVDYGSRGLVLIRTPRHLLVWRKPGSVWSGIGMPHSYVPAYLHVIRNKEDAHSYGNIGSVGGRDMLKGGRLTMERLAKVLPELKKIMRLPLLTMAQIDLKKTLVVVG